MLHTLKPRPDFWTGC